MLLLGTGGAANECRHQACLLVQRADPAAPPILLDTGNGLDLVRALLAAGVDPLQIQDVFVSHRHADHAGGLDEQAESVHRMAHSTAGDAGRAARAAGVGRLYLTHLPDDALADALLAEAGAAFGGSVELAVDQGIVEI